MMRPSLRRLYDPRKLVLVEHLDEPTQSPGHEEETWQGQGKEGQKRMGVCERQSGGVAGLQGVVEARLSIRV
jgi:hypothetical protein